MPQAHLTHHARRRWDQRGGAGSASSALRGAVKVPARLGVRLKWRGGNARKERHHGVSFRVTATGLFIVRGSTVVTTTPLELGGLATVLTWMLTGLWVEG